MNDYDVRVGVTTVGDTAGAEKVDGALDKVGQTAQRVSRETADSARESSAAATDAAANALNAAKSVDGIADKLSGSGAAAESLGGLSKEIGGLETALDKLSPEKAQKLVGGLTQTIMGLGSGEVTDGLAGLARHLQGLAGLLPNPALVGVVAAASGAIAALFRAMAKDAEEPNRKLNELGETVDEEMARIESWAQSQFEWEGIKNADANLRADFTTVKDSADSALASVTALFKARSDAKVSALQRQISEAESSGDTSRAQDLKAQVEVEKATAELVRLNIEMAQAKTELASQTALARQAEENFKALVAKAEEQKRQLDELNRTIVALTGNKDATVPGSDAYQALVDQTRGKASYLNDEAERLAKVKGYEDLAAARRVEAQAVSSLLDNLLNLAGQNKQVADSEKTVAEARGKSSENAAASASEMTKLGLQIEALKVKLQDAAEAAGPDAAQKAAEQAGLITGAVGDMLEKQLQLSVDNSRAIIDVAASGAEGASAAAGDLETAKKKYRASLEDGQVPAAVEGLGANVADSSEAAAEVIVEGADQIQKAVEGTAAAAGAAGDEIQGAASDFRTKIKDAATLWKSGADDLASSVRSNANIARQLAEQQARIAQEISSTNAVASAALDTARLALSQIKNIR